MTWNSAIIMQPTTRADDLLLYKTPDIFPKTVLPQVISGSRLHLLNADFVHPHFLVKQVLANSSCDIGEIMLFSRSLTITMSHMQPGTH